MIDQHGKTDLLIARLEESLPIEANITPPLAKLLTEKSPGIPIPATCNVTSVFYTGDVGGIICGLDIGGPNTGTPHLVSITHLTSTDAFRYHARSKLTNAIGPKSYDDSNNSAIDSQRHNQIVSKLLGSPRSGLSEATHGEDSAAVSPLMTPSRDCLGCRVPGGHARISPDRRGGRWSSSLATTSGPHL